MYGEVAVDHFTNPRNVGVVERPDGVGQESNPRCGDFTRISLRVREGAVSEIAFKTFGCSAAIAAASMVTTLVAGESVERAARVIAPEIITALGGLPPGKEGCAAMAAAAVRSALAAARAIPA
jgi:nitrogen fixation NifU-like protein